MKQKVTIELIDFLLILLFVYAATSKLWEYNTFKIQLDNSPYLKPFAGIIAWLIPISELTITVMLTVTYTRKKGLFASFILLLIFTLYIVGMLSGINLPRSCDDVIRQLSWKQYLVFNLVVIALSGAVIKLYRSNKNMVATHRLPVQQS
jgi:hypothetical protein